MLFKRSFHDKQTAMRVTVEFLSLFRTLTGVERDVLDVAEGTTIDRLSRLLVQKYQNLPMERGKTFFMINGRLCTRNEVLEEGDRIKIFQLSAGG